MNRYSQLRRQTLQPHCLSSDASLADASIAGIRQNPSAERNRSKSIAQFRVEDRSNRLSGAISGEIFKEPRRTADEHLVLCAARKVHGDMRVVERPALLALGRPLPPHLQASLMETIRPSVMPALRA